MSPKSDSTIGRLRAFSGTLFLILPFLIPGLSNAQQITEIGRTDKMASNFVAQLMESEHLSRREINDSISIRAFDMFVKSLDPTKSYFMQSDIEEFTQWKSVIDDQMKKGDFSAALSILILN